MKIVYFIDHLRSDGGTQRVLGQLVRGLAARGHSQTVICLLGSDYEPLATTLREAGAQVVIISEYSLVTGYFAIDLMLILRRGKFDVAITLLFVGDTVGRTLAHFARVPRIVSSIRARNINYPPWKRWMVRQTMCWADAVILNSAGVRDFAISQEGAPQNHTSVILNSIDVTAYRCPVTRESLLQEFKVAPTRYVIGSVGRIVPQKGFDLLTSALARMREQDVSLLILGSGSDEQALRAQAAQLGISHRVYFGGFRRDVSRLLGAFDLYVHPARFEGMPNAVLEAMAAGCPIVATAVDGTPELITDGQHGWLVPPEHITALAKAMDAALENPTEARRRGNCAQQRAETDFGEQTMVLAWEKILHG